MTDVLPDPDGEFGARVRRRLREETVVWLTTAGADGTPQPNPVWFLAQDDGTILVYNQAKARRLRHVRDRPRVALNFNSDDNGGDVVVLTGVAEIVEDHPRAYDVPAYVDKYGPAAAQISGDVRAFADDYPVALRIRLDHVRGF